MSAPLDFHPLHNNVLDFLDVPLETAGGYAVKVVKRTRGGGFDVQVGAQRYEDVSNLEASGILNQFGTRRSVPA